MPFASGLFTQDDFLQIENVLYTPIEEELIHRRIFSINSSWASFAREIGYDYWRKNGTAKILASGGGAKDVPFVGEDGGRVSQKVYTIVSGVRFTKAEMEAVAAKRALGKGPAMQLDTNRVASARRFIFEKEAALAFAGDTEYGIKGLFDSTFYGTDLGTMENVAQGATGADAAAKRLFANKTATEILTDLRTGRKAIQKDGLFKARTLVLPPEEYEEFTKPFSDYDSNTLLSWLNTKGMYFEQIVTSNQMSATYNGDTVNYFLMMDNSPMNVELSLINDISLGDPVIDIVGTQEQAVLLDTAGIIVRHPGALYVGKGI